ncbi:hypothetical protein TWF694_005049 [Orbilia ellipsospora]|uniref:FACT complex subunit n=1 Tax=Orbilia ellipsospora TaxID=2528407 RepID=A0AAV9WVG1_9PEZI
MWGGGSSPRSASRPKPTKDELISIDARVFSHKGKGFGDLPVTFLDLQSTHADAILHYEEVAHMPGQEEIALNLFCEISPQRFQVKVDETFILAMEVPSSCVMDIIESTDDKKLVLVVNSKRLVEFGSLRMEIQFKSQDVLRKLKQLLIFKHRAMETEHRKKVTQIQELWDLKMDSFGKGPNLATVPELMAKGYTHNSCKQLEAKCWKLIFKTAEWKRLQAPGSPVPKILDDLCDITISQTVRDGKDAQDTKTSLSNSRAQISPDEVATSNVETINSLRTDDAFVARFSKYLSDFRNHAIAR